MPITIFLFARGEPEVERAFLAHPRWSKATYRFEQCDGLTFGPEGLLAVDLRDDAFDARWESTKPAAPVTATRIR
jgi:hypothetical protein